jgi:hypothetical protein
MLVIDASVLVDALLVAGPARVRVASDNLQAPELIDAELLSVLRRLVLADKLPEGHALQALATAERLGLRRSPQPLPLAPGLGAAHQPLRLRRPVRSPGRAARCPPAHRRCPPRQGTWTTLPRGGAGAVTTTD